MRAPVRETKLSGQGGGRRDTAGLKVLTGMAAGERKDVRYSKMMEIRSRSTTITKDQRRHLREESRAVQDPLRNFLPPTAERNRT